MTNPLIPSMREKRDALKAKAEAIVSAADAEDRDLSEDEDLEFRSLLGQVKSADERIAELLAAEERAAEAGKFATKVEAARPAVVKSQPLTYGPDGRNSYFRDLARAIVLGESEARERIGRHGAEMRDLNRTDTSGGEFVPPLHLVSDFLAKERAGRVTADLCNKMPLPPGTDSINIPKVSTGTAVAIQTADNAAVTETDMVTAMVTAPVRTIAGQQDIAIQLLDQSPIAFDQVLFADLMSDYASKLDVQVIDGSDASGQVEGILAADSINTVTYTDASPTVAELYPKLADAINKVHTNRFLPPTAIVMHPRRWAWMLAALDSSNRPFVTPVAPQNSLGAFGAVASEGPVGSIMGVPVYVDPNVPTNKGAGTDEDRIIVARMSDIWLFESAVRSRVLPEVLSGNLTVRFQVYGYLAFSAERYPTGITVISGTGLVAPSF